MKEIQYEIVKEIAVLSKGVVLQIRCTISMQIRCT